MCVCVSVCVCVCVCVCERERERETETETETDRQTDRQTETETETERQRDRKILIKVYCFVIFLSSSSPCRSVWMTICMIKRKLSDKTKAVITSSGRKFGPLLSSSLPDYVTVGSSTVPLSDSVKNLGVTFPAN